MGIDRSNVRCVIHAAMPKSIEHYQQETGRAGRDGLDADCVMLYSRADPRRWAFILDKAEETPAEVLAAQKALVYDLRDLCENHVCRHAQLSRYFGQPYDQENCGACDVCRPPAEASPSPDDGWHGVDRDLFERLRTIRRRLAQDRSVQAYIISSDDTLRDLARYRPATLLDMKRIKGLGERKLASFGRLFLDEIRTYCRENGVPFGTVQAPLRRVQRTESTARTPTLSLSKRRAFDMFRSGATVGDVARGIGRAPGTAAQYLAEFIDTERPESVSAWVSPDLYGRIKKASDNAGIERLKPVFEELGGEVSYDDIRIVVGHLRALAGNSI
jgi:hypothetical protein